MNRNYMDSEHSQTSLPKENLVKQNKEKEVLGIIKEIEVPFMESLKRVYDDGEGENWRMCGPACIALSRIISARTNIPIELNSQKEHIELTIGIFDPKNNPNRFDLIEDQTYIRYFTGDGNVYYIDPIYGLLMENKKQLDGVIQIEKYSVNEIDEALIQKHDLYPFDPNHDGLEKCTGAFFSIFNTPKERQMFIADSTTAFNDERATMSKFVADSGRIATTDFVRTKVIIREFAPQWK